VVPLVVAGAAAAAVVVTNALDFQAGFSSRLLNANLSASWSHRATAVALVAGTVIALLRAGRAGDRLLWTLSGIALLALFVVEVSSVHVEVDRLSYGKLIYLPLLIALVWGVSRLAAGRAPAALVRAGVLTLIISYAIHVFGVHIVEALGWGIQSLAYQLKVGVKQGTELAGWLMLVLALWRLAGLTRSSAPAALDDRLGGARKLSKWAIGSRRERA